MFRVDGVTHAASDVDAEYQCVDHFASGCANMFRQGQNRRSHWTCWVDDGFEVSVVKVKGVRGDAVD